MEKIKNIKITEMEQHSGMFKITAEFCGKKIFNYSTVKYLTDELEWWAKLAQSGDYAFIRGDYFTDEYQFTSLTDDWYVTEKWSLSYKTNYSEIIIVKNNEIKLSFNADTDTYYIDKEYRKKFNVATK